MSLILSFIYFFFKLLPTCNKVTMISRQSNDPSDEFLMIKSEIESRHKGTKVVLLCKTLDGKENSSKLTRLRYAFHMLVQMYHIATSQVVLLDTYCIVVSLLKHKKSLTVIQMWHSIGTMKKFGYAVVDSDEGVSRKLAESMHMHENYDFVFASSLAYANHLAAGFNCSRDIILPMPLPRVDKLINDKAYEQDVRERIFNKYPELKSDNKKNILYAPTFRMNENEFEIAVKKLIDAVDKGKFNLIVSLHPLSPTKEALKGNPGCILPEGFNSFEMIFAADYMITDYSCILYEAGLRDVPLLFYNFDMDSYVGDRGLALDYKELPGIIEKSPEKIAEAISEMAGPASDNSEYMSNQRSFIDKYVKNTSHATKDIVDFVYKYIV